nr:ADP-ribose pyrophosphatase [Vibrio sp. Y29_XK_CS5]
MNKEVRVGATTIILRDGKIMLGESIGSHGANAQ